MNKEYIYEMDEANELISQIGTSEEVYEDFGKDEGKRQIEYGNLDYYQRLKEENKVIKVRFSGIRGSVLFVLYDEVELRYSLVGHYFGKVPRECSESALDRDYIVQVKEIKEEEKVIILEDADGMLENREDAIRLINDHLEKGESELYLRGQIVGLQYSTGGKQHAAHAAYVNIGGLGIVGILPIQYWSSAYVTDAIFKDTIEQHVGALINFRINSRRRLENGMYAYVCNRAAYLKKIGRDPWKLVESRLRPKSNVVVKIVDEGRSEGCMFGMIDGIPDLNMLCYIDGASDLKMAEVKIGRYYYGYIQKVNVETKFLRVRLTGIANRGGGILETLENENGGDEHDQAE